VRFYRKGQRGFSLLEILVAFTILAMGLAVILQIFGRGNQTSQLTREYTLATQIAESRLAQLSGHESFEGLSTAGMELDRYRWSLSVLPYNETGTTTGTANMALYSVRVDVRWQSLGKPRHVFLESVRLVPIITG